MKQLLVLALAAALALGSSVVAYVSDGRESTAPETGATATSGPSPGAVCTGDQGGVGDRCGSTGDAALGRAVVMSP